MKILSEKKQKRDGVKKNNNNNQQTNTSNDLHPPRKKPGLTCKVSQGHSACRSPAHSAQSKATALVSLT